MHNIDLIATITGGLAAALVLGYITNRLGLSPIVGYLLAGFVVGPNTPGFVANKQLADQLAEIGVILLMFGVGLQFHLKELLAVRRIAIPGAVFQSLGATALGALMGVAFGWSLAAGLVFGLAISVASTVVLMRILADNNELHTPTGHIAIGWLVVEDLFTVLVLVLLPAIFSTSQVGTSNVLAVLGAAILKLGAMVAFTFFVGGRIIPWLLGHIAAMRSRELFMLTVLVVALGIAVGSALLFGASMALGAFLAGMVVGRSEFSLRAAAEALPMRDAFAVLFFVSVGMLFDPHYLVAEPGLVAATLAIILLGKPLAALLIVLLLKYPLRVALTIAVVLAQIGEFSFILSTLGKSLGILDDRATNTLVAAAIVSITLNPLFYRLIDPMEAWLRRRRSNALAQTEIETDKSDGSDAAPVSTFHHRAIIVGYGPVGRTVTRLLRENDVEPTIIEMNLETVRRLREEGMTAIYGDASHYETLKAAEVRNAVSFIISAAGMRSSAEMIRVAKELNPKIRILARAAYLRELPALQQAGADAVFSGEGEVALTMMEFILRQLGATPEQIDRERDRIREELFGAVLPIPPAATLSEPSAPDGLLDRHEIKSSLH
jgi:CPA2 family monovalent cation:H+ antiporter-2